ncbi:orotate phosphoribosyltransferase [Tepidibacillus marianensis]|uniref:orotate phosphoribosyltransferase n=1 Tax=Tepidibacillus marianensis TaxID=3131995 RepID=UPI0030CCCAD1
MKEQIKEQERQSEIVDLFQELGVLKEGHFLLTSGRHSNRYMQMAQLLQYPDQTEKLCRILAERLATEEIDLVVSPAVGGILVGYEMAKILNTRNIFCERENGKMTLRRGFQIQPGEKVLVAEDVVTTGGSVKEVINVIRENGGNVVEVGVLVDRSNGTVEFGVPFQSILSLEVESYVPDICPLCKEGLSPAIKPGSRGLK